MRVLKLYDLIIASELCNIRNSVDNIVDFILECHGILREDALFEIKVVLNELLQNAIKHGNKQDSSKLVKVRTGIGNRYVYFIVEDEGEGFESNCIVRSESVLDICDLKENGRGILIVKSLCDSVRFNSRGNKIVVLKRLE